MKKKYCVIQLEGICDTRRGGGGEEAKRNEELWRNHGRKKNQVDNELLLWGYTKTDHDGWTDKQTEFLRGFNLLD